MANYINGIDVSLSQKYGPIVPLAAYGNSTSVVIDVSGMNEKVFLIKNTGAASLNWQILASIDDGAEYDITEKTEVAVLSGASEIYRTSNLYTHLKVQVKSAGSTTAIIKFVTQSV